MSLTDLKELLSTSWKRQEGQTMAEYGIVLAVIITVASTTVCPRSLLIRRAP